MLFRAYVIRAVRANRKTKENPLRSRSEKQTKNKNATELIWLPFVTPSVWRVVARQFLRVLVNSKNTKNSAVFQRTSLSRSRRYAYVHSLIVFLFRYRVSPFPYLAVARCQTQKTKKKIKQDWVWPQVSSMRVFARAFASIWIIVSNKLISNSFSSASVGAFFFLFARCRRYANAWECWSVERQPNTRDVNTNSEY